jgi:hypothetical protein
VPASNANLQVETTIKDLPAVLHETKGFTLASWENITVCVWMTQATVPLCDKLDELSAPFVKAHPEGISSIHVIGNGALLPGAAARRRLEEITERYALDLACVGTVLEGAGFWMSAFLSFLTGIHRLSAHPFESYTCTSIRAIAAWMPSYHAKRTGKNISDKELEQVLRLLRMRPAHDGV